MIPGIVSSQYRIGGGDEPPVVTGTVYSLLHFDTSTTRDEAIGTWRRTADGSPVIDTEISKFGQGSVYINGVSSETISGTPIEHTGSPTGIFHPAIDFTIEAWIRPIYKSEESVICQNGNRTGTEGLQNGVKLSILNGKIRFQVSGSTNTTAQHLDSLVDFPFDDEFHHVAATKEGNTIRIFQDGVMVGQHDLTNNPNSSGTLGRFSIGRWRSGGSGASTWGTVYHGHIDEFRLILDQALYTSNFTPPNAPFPNPDPELNSVPNLEKNEDE